MFYVMPLEGKHYGTLIEDTESDLTLTIWVGFKKYTTDEVSPRELEAGWYYDLGYDHVESVYDIESAQAVCDKLNELIYKNQATYQKEAH